LATAIGLVGCSGVAEEDDEPCDPADRTCEAYHWDLADGCITTSVHPSLSGMHDELADLVASWNSVECSQLCLAPPVLMDVRVAPEENPHHISFVPFEALPWPDTEDGRIQETDVYYDTCTWVILQVEVGIRQDIDQQEALDWAARAFRYAMMFGHAAGEDTSESIYPGVTVGEVEALCELYGDDPLCGE
jgi:hypothetical protein